MINIFPTCYIQLFMRNRGKNGDIGSLFLKKIYTLVIIVRLTPTSSLLASRSARAVTSSPCPWSTAASTCTGCTTTTTAATRRTRATTTTRASRRCATSAPSPDRHGGGPFLVASCSCKGSMFIDLMCSNYEGRFSKLTEPSRLQLILPCEELRK